MTGWAELTRRSLDELRTTDETYRPTNFWGPGVDRLLSEMETIGLAKFKSWPSAPIWFYPMYGNGWTEATLAKALQSAKQVNPRADQGYFYNSLNGWFEARRDFDVAMMAWDQHRWPFDIGGHGESKVGSPWQAFGVSPEEVPSSAGRTPTTCCCWRRFRGTSIVHRPASWRSAAVSAFSARSCARAIRKHGTSTSTSRRC